MWRLHCNANGWVVIPQLGIDDFKQGREQLRKAAQENGRDPNSIEYPILAFPEVSENDLGSDRQPMNGSIQQIAQDIKEFENLGVNHINLVFDFGSHAADLDKRLKYSKQIQDAVKKWVKYHAAAVAIFVGTRIFLVFRKQLFLIYIWYELLTRFIILYKIMSPELKQQDPLTA